MSRSEGATAHVVPLLEAYAAGALAPEEAERVARHLGDCADCQNHLEQIRLYQIIRAAPAPTVGLELRQRVYARIAEANATASGSNRAPLATRHASRADSTAHRHGGLARGGWLSGVAAVLLVALLVSLFWALPHIRQVGKRAAHHTTLTTACPASKTKVDLPENVTLNDLAMTSTSDGWTVGDIDNANGEPTQGVMMRYSDCHWSQAALNLKDISLTHLSMDSPTDGWASGQWASGSANYGDGFALLHYTGGAWSVVPTAQRPANHGSVFALSMRTPDDGWLVTIGPDTASHGSMISVEVYRVWHYQRGTWSLVDHCPITFPEVIAPTGPDDLWVAGSSFTGPYKEQAQYLARYHNGAWTQIASPDALQVWSMRAVSPTDIWASGIDGNSSGFGAVAHYDGVAWRMAPDAVPVLPTPALTPGATPSPTGPSAQIPQPGEFNGMVTITGEGAGWAYDWKAPDKGAILGSQATIASMYREDGGKWQSLNWPYSDVGAITSWAALPDGEVWAIANWRTMESAITPLPGGGGTMSVSFTAYLLHYANGEWSRFVTSSNTFG